MGMSDRSADLGADLLPGHVRQHQVEHDERGLHTLGESKAFGSGAGDRHLEAVPFEIGANDVLDRRLIVDHHDPHVLSGGHLDACIPTGYTAPSSARLGGATRGGGIMTKGWPAVSVPPRPTRHREPRRGGLTADGASGVAV